MAGDVSGLFAALPRADDETRAALEISGPISILRDRPGANEWAWSEIRPTRRLPTPT